MDKTLGEGFIPESQQLQVALFDASDFCSFSTVRLKDSINTAGSNFSYGMLGVVNDSRLGKTSAGFATAFTPVEYGREFGEGVTKFDSAFLVLNFPTNAPPYGLGKDPMNFLVYEMKSTIGDVVYGTAPGLIDTMIYPKLVNVGGAKVVSYDSTKATIRLSDELLPKLFKVENADTFAANFKGLYITVNDTGVTNGCIKYADIISSSNYISAIMAYYNNSDTTTVAYTYYVYSNTPRFNVYRHDYKALTQTSDVLYMQGLCGVATQMTFNLDSVSAWVEEGKKHIAVNRAELVLPVEDSSNYSAIDELYAETMGCLSMISGSYGTTLDTYSSAFGGAINRSKMEYSINITHTFNEALIKGVNNPTFLVPQEFINNAQSIFISNRAGRKPQLKIWYSEIR